MICYASLHNYHQQFTVFTHIRFTPTPSINTKPCRQIILSSENTDLRQHLSLCLRWYLRLVLLRCRLRAANGGDGRSDLRGHRRVLLRRRLGLVLHVLHLLLLHLLELHVLQLLLHLLLIHLLLEVLLLQVLLHVVLEMLLLHLLLYLLMHLMLM